MDEMNSREIAVQLRGVKKRYKLGQIGGGTLQGDLQSWWARVRGREDPNTKIGADQQLIGQTFMALNGIDLTIYKGERIGIIGHNGAGKSTMLKLLSRVTAPTEGEIDIYGRIASMLEVGTGFHPELTGRENIYMNGAILGMTKKEIDAKMEDIIEFSECRQFIDTPVKRYSSGMYVKLAFSVAAHLDSEIMIMDEVLAVGDMAFQKKCLDKMSDVSKSQGRTILYVSHNMNTIRQLCERVIVLDHGKVVFDGDVESGIGVYSGVASDDFPVVYNFKDTPRPSSQHGVDLIITKLNFEATGQACFNRTEPIRFSVTFDCKKYFDSLKLYFVLRHINGDIIGLAQSYDGTPNCYKGNMYTFSFKFDASNLTEGEYQFYLDMFTYDAFGNHYSVDHPMQVIRFKLVENEQVGLNWQAQYYGHVRLNPITLCEREL